MKGEMHMKKDTEEELRRRYEEYFENKEEHHVETLLSIVLELLEVETSIQTNFCITGFDLYGAVGGFFYVRFFPDKDYDSIPEVESILNEMRKIGYNPKLLKPVRDFIVSLKKVKQCTIEDNCLRVRFYEKSAKE